MTIANPQFLYANDYTDTAAMATSSNNSTAFKTRLLDRRPRIQFTTTGQTGSSATFIYTPGDSPSISRIAIQNTNWAAFTATYNGGTAFSTPINVSGASGGDFYFEFNAVTITSDITITVTATSPAGAEKKVGQIIYSRNLYTFPDFASAMSFTADPQQSIVRLSSGRYVRYLIDSEIYGFQASMKFVSLGSAITNIKTLLDENDINAVFFIPMPSQSVGEWDGIGDHVFIQNGREIRNFSGMTLQGGNDVIFDMVPAGGT